MTQVGGASAGLEAPLPSHRHLAFEQQSQPVGVLQAPRLGLIRQILEALRHTMEAEIGEKVESGMGQHDDVCPQWK